MTQPAKFSVALPVLVAAPEALGSSARTHAWPVTFAWATARALIGTGLARKSDDSNGGCGFTRIASTAAVLPALGPLFGGQLSVNELGAVLAKPFFPAAWSALTVS